MGTLDRRTFLQAGMLAATAAAAGGWGPADSAAQPETRAGDKLILVENGKPIASIVIAAAPSENARVAAEELQRYLEKMSGARLPIVTDAAPPSGPLVLIGKSRLTDAMRGLEIPSGRTKDLHEEGFVIRCRD